MLVATPNIAVDRVVRLAALRPGSVLRTGRARGAAGGKGVNVGRARAADGHRATLVGFQPSVDADLVRRLMSAEPVDFVGVPVAGEVRVATIHLEESGRVTVLNEPGPDIDPAGWSAYEDAIADALATG